MLPYLLPPGEKQLSKEFIRVRHFFSPENLLPSHLFKLGHVLPIPKPNFVAWRMEYAGKQGPCLALSSPDPGEDKMGWAVGWGWIRVLAERKSTYCQQKEGEYTQKFISLGVVFLLMKRMVLNICNYYKRIKFQGEKRR